MLSVPAEHVDELLELAAAEDVEATVIGQFGTQKQRIGIAVSADRKSADWRWHFCMMALPMPTRKAMLSNVKPHGRQQPVGIGR